MLIRPALTPGAPTRSENDAGGWRWEVSRACEVRFGDMRPVSSENPPMWREEKGGAHTLGPSGGPTPQGPCHPLFDLYRFVALAHRWSGRRKGYFDWRPFLRLVRKVERGARYHPAVRPVRKVEWTHADNRSRDYYS